MTDKNDSTARSPAALAGSLWRASFIGLTLVLLSVAPWLLIVLHTRQAPDVVENLRRSRFAELWPSISEGAAVAAVLNTMGPPDAKRDQQERIPDCGGTCDVPCDKYRTCVVEYEWQSEPKTDRADLYLACADASGIVRRTSHGIMVGFNAGLTDSYTLADLVAWGVLATLFALPLAFALGMKRRFWPKRMTEIK